ncbi:MAG: hypothetical protein J6F30_16895 [Cellulosilyticum sp.]|nr:hypothetical protein [Cellulosilyticum sp.]
MKQVMKWLIVSVIVYVVNISYHGERLYAMINEPISGSKIVPYSISNLNFGINISAIKETDDQISKIKALTFRIETKPILETHEYSVVFEEVSGQIIAQVGILKCTQIDSQGLKKYQYDAKLSKQCMVTCGKDYIDIKCMGDWLELEDFKIVVYLKTKDILKESEVISIDKYEECMMQNTLKFRVSHMYLDAEYQLPVIQGETNEVIGYETVEKSIWLPDTEIETQYSKLARVI